jgi:hypothetical protein
MEKSQDRVLRYRPIFGQDNQRTEGSVGRAGAARGSPALDRPAAHRRDFCR